jgi:Animal haem peroxidase
MQTPNQQPIQDACMFEDSLYRSYQPTAASLAVSEDDFGKMFPDLPSFEDGQDPTDLLHRLEQLARKGGPMDALDPTITVTNPLAGNDADRNPNNPNPDMTVGFTFLGQFLDHDITFDPAPLMAGSASRNLRTPFFDLDSVYGRGPDEDRVLYDRAGELDRPTAARFLIDFDAARDLPRTSQQRAITADPRNDENIIISQLHLAFLRFHNRVTDKLETEMTDAPPSAVFEEARRVVRWHYQWIIVHQFLAATLDPAVYEQVKADGPTLFPPTMTPKIPREFQVAAYRFGHSQVRPGYKINVGFGAPIFDARIDPREGDPNDLRGGRRALRRFVEWDTFFDFGTKEVNPETGAIRPKVKQNKRIDPFLSTPLFTLPVGPGLPGPADDVRTLAGRNLERHIQHHLASGQDIAVALGYPPLQTADFPEDVQALRFHEQTPLWYYILLEALVQKGGQRLGQVGSRIVAEVFLGLLLSDSESYLTSNPNWTPTLPQRDGRVTGEFTMTDLLTFAGVA